MIATVELVARSHPFPLKRTFLGTAYDVAPTRTIVFDKVSGLLSRFRSLTANTPTWAQVERDDTGAPASDDGKTSTLTLVPTKSGERVTSRVVLVDDAAGLVRRVHAPASIDVAARFPGYSVDGTIRLSKYRTNVPVAANSMQQP